jgi:hypothetical protein
VWNGRIAWKKKSFTVAFSKFPISPLPLYFPFPPRRRRRRETGLMFVPAWGSAENTTITAQIQRGEISLALQEKEFLERVSELNILDAEKVPSFVKAEAARFVKNLGLCSLTKGLLLLMRRKTGRQTSFHMAFSGPAPAWCYPDRGSIYVNFFEPPAFYPEMVKALILHELGHVAYTENSKEEKSEMKESGALASLSNILEDRFIEAKVAEDISLTDDLFADLHRIYISSIYAGRTFSDPRRLLYVIALAPCRTYRKLNDGGMDWKSFFEKLGIRTDFKGERDEEFCETWWNFAAKAEKAADSHETFRLAKEFIERFPEYFPKREAPPIKMPSSGGDGTPHGGGFPDDGEGGPAEPGDTVDMTDADAVDALEEENNKPGGTGSKRKGRKRTHSHKDFKPHNAKDFPCNVVEAERFTSEHQNWSGPVRDGRQFARKITAKINGLAQVLMKDSSREYHEYGGRLDVRRAVSETALKGYPEKPFVTTNSSKTKAPILAIDCLIDCSGSMGAPSEVPGITASGAAAGIGACFLELGRLTPWVDARVFTTTMYGGTASIAQFTDPQDLVRLNIFGDEGFIAYRQVRNVPSLLFVITDGFFCNPKDVEMFHELQKRGVLAVGMYVGALRAKEDVEKNLQVFSMNKVATEPQEVFAFLMKFFSSEIQKRKLGRDAGKFSSRRRVWGGFSPA